MTKSEKIQSFTAVFIAVMALVISLWQGCEERRHNRFSVRPLLTFDNTSSGTTKSIRLSNNGLGPALIKAFVITVNSSRYYAKDVNPWQKVVEARNLQGKYSQMYYFANGSHIKVDSKTALFTWEADSIRNLDISISIKYNSIYSEEFEVEESF